MKTVIYYNVTTGESFDQDGSLRTSNNPFSASYGERRSFEWHLMTSTNPDLDVSQWTPWTDWDIAPQSAVVAADDNYLTAYPGYLKESVTAGSGAITVVMDSSPEKIAPSGNLRIFRQDHSVLILPYFAVNNISDGFVFSVEVTEEFSAGIRIDILEEPLVSAELNLNSSTLDQGIFAFDLTLNGWKLAEKMEYSDTELLTAKGLELCITGIDPDTEEQVILLRCQIPFVIKNVLTSLNFIV